MAANEQKLTYSCLILLHFIATDNGNIVTVVCNV